MAKGQNTNQRQKQALVRIFIMAGILLLAYFASRHFVRGKSDQSSSVTTDQKQKERNPATTFVWLLVGLAPIPMALIIISAKPGAPAAQSFLLCAMILAPVCNLLGGIGCLGGIKNVAVRVILGILLSAFFFALTVVVAVFQACSNSHL